MSAFRTGPTGTSDFPGSRCAKPHSVTPILDSLNQWTAGDESFRAMMACRRKVIVQRSPEMPLHEQEELMDHFEAQVKVCTREELRRLLGPHAMEFPELDA
jgi:hypothetical protein